MATGLVAGTDGVGVDVAGRGVDVVTDLGVGVGVAWPVRRSRDS